jgi:hypothetical protein
MGHMVVSILGTQTDILTPAQGGTTKMQMTWNPSSLGSWGIRPCSPSTHLIPALRMYPPHVLYMYYTQYPQITYYSTSLCADYYGTGSSNIL